MILLGKYPKVSLAKVGEERDKCLGLLARGVDLSLHRRLAKDAKTRQAEDAFEGTAKEWLLSLLARSSRQRLRSCAPSPYSCSTSGRADEQAEEPVCADLDRCRHI